MVFLIIIPIKWLFHWEYTQHFQTNPYVDGKTLIFWLSNHHLLLATPRGFFDDQGSPYGGFTMWNHVEILWNPKISWTLIFSHLVGGLEHGFYFPFHIWDVILPIFPNSIIFGMMVKLHHQPVIFLLPLAQWGGRFDGSGQADVVHCRLAIFCTLSRVLKTPLLPPKATGRQAGHATPSRRVFHGILWCFFFWIWMEQWHDLKINTGDFTKFMLSNWKWHDCLFQTRCFAVVQIGRFNSSHHV